MDADGEASREITLKRAWQLLKSSRQILIFFSFLMLFTLGLFMQDPLLESYGADVFGLPISQSTILNALWGMGTLVGLLLAGFLVTPRIGKMASARLGCQLILVSLLLLIAVGFKGEVLLLQIVMVLFGLAAGIATNAALSLMLDLTLPTAAATFVGAWGLAQALSRALGKLLGGGLLDLGRVLIPGDAAFPAYAFVLFIEALVMVAALAVLKLVSVRQFRSDTQTRLSSVLVAELD